MAAKKKAKATKQAKAKRPVKKAAPKAAKKTAAKKAPKKAAAKKSAAKKPAAKKAAAKKPAAKKAAAKKPAAKKPAAKKPAAAPAASSGRFVWHEYAAKDVPAAIAFYGPLFGWTTAEMEMGPGAKYTILKTGETQVGGMTGVETEQTPAHWRLYCTVPDVDAAVVKAKELGGSEIVPAMDIPTVGRFALVADPQGALLFPFKEAQESAELAGPPGAGTFCWDELLTSDAAAAVEFYKAIYGWTTTTTDMGPMGTYYVLHRGERMAGGVMGLPMPGVPPHWQTHVAVTDLEATVKHAESLGGHVVMPPTPVPNMGRFAVILDPQGAPFAVFQGNAA